MRAIWFISLLLITVCVIDAKIAKKNSLRIRTNEARKIKAIDSLQNVVVADVKSGVEKHSPWYSKLIPIYPNEAKKFFSLSFMMFSIIFVFTMTRDTKDALVVTNCGAESIAFLKVYGTIPAATGFMVLYSYLSSKLSTINLFYAILAPFFAFFTTFAFLVYPNHQRLHFYVADFASGGSTYVLNLFRYWTFSLYYIAAELWGSVGVPLLFWTCANDVVRVDEARRMYPVMSMIGNLGPIFAGLVTSFVSDFVARRSLSDEDAFQTSLKILSLLMLGAGSIIAILHKNIRAIHAEEKLLMQQNNKELRIVPKENVAAPQKHKKPTFQESVKILAGSEYLRNIAVMVLSYGLTIEFTEIIWKSAVKMAIPDKTEYINFMGRCSSLVGVAAFVMMFVGTSIVQAAGWKAGALITPVMMGALAAPFFGILLTKSYSSKKALLLAVYVGLMQNVLSKATKYAIFDPTKEMTYIPLDPLSKTKGKAAIDVLGAKLGKSAGALIQQLLILICGNIFASAPVLTGLFYAVLFIWLSKY